MQHGIKRNTRALDDHRKCPKCEEHCQVPQTASATNRSSRQHHSISPRARITSGKRFCTFIFADVAVRELRNANADLRAGPTKARGPGPTVSVLLQVAKGLIIILGSRVASSSTDFYCKASFRFDYCLRLQVRLQAPHALQAIMWLMWLVSVHGQEQPNPRKKTTFFRKPVFF